MKDKAYVEFMFENIEDANVYIFKGSRAKPDFIIKDNEAVTVGAPIRVAMGDDILIVS